MNPHPNVKLAEEAWDAVSRSDTEALRLYWSDQLVWHVNDDGGPLAGDRVGVEEIIDYLAQVGELGDDYSIQLRDIIANDDYVFVMSQVRIVRKGEVLDAPFVLIGRVDDHQLAEVWSLAMEPGRVREFWAR